MYSLLVSGAAGEGDLGSFAFVRDRFLEYTDDVISVQLQSLSREAIDALRSWPCVFMEEGKGNEIARVVELDRIGVKPRELTISVRAVEDAPELTNDAIWKLRGELDIAEFEFSRNHWAVKEGDLIGTLASAGYPVSDRLRAHFANLPLPAPTRGELLRARAVIGEWGHTEIDDLVLELGIDEMTAGREVGSRQDRAIAIVKYAIANPSANTAENSLLSSYLVQRTTSANPEVGVAIATHPNGAPAEVSHGPLEATVVSPSTPLPQSKGDSRSPNRVFVVHGRNESARVAVATYLNSIGLEAIVLHEQPNMGRHLLTKFIEEAELVTFAVVLMTDDDVGSVKGGELAPRSRQNVILELGYFLSHLGQSNVCALISPGLETPSDFDGIVYISMTSDGSWRRELYRELVAAGMPVHN
jgi:hypothetical protein